MIHLVYSNRTEELLSALSSRVGREREEHGLYAPLHLVVPNPNVEAYLKQGLAEELGIAANLKTCFLASLVRDLLRDAAPGVRVIDRELLEGQVLAVLLDKQAMQHPELEEARVWLSASGESDAAMDERRFQLALQLARLFDEYAGSRPDMLDLWLKRLHFGDNKAARHVEVWQRRLWLMVMDRLRERERDEEVQYRLLRDVFRGLRPSELTLPSTLFVFGFSYFPRAYQAFFDTLAKACEVHIFTLNPCREFWEDAGKEDEKDMPLLRLWGRPGRDHVASLNELTGADFEDHFVESNDPSLLAHVQNDVLVRAQAIATAPIRDDSIVLTTCPSMRREAEEVAVQIWSAIESSAKSGRPLRFHEIGVFINPTERDAYLAHLTTAFRDNHSIPHHVVDLPLTMESRFVEAVGLLLDLPNGRFGRAEMLRLLTHPALASRYRHVNVERWVELVDELAIMHGADRADHAGTYIDADSFNWDQGIKRIALGAFMSASPDASPYVEEGRAYAPYELTPSLREDAALLGATVRALIHDARDAAQKTLSMREWAAYLRKFVKAHLGSRDDAGERDLVACLKAIDDLSRVDLGDTRVSFQIARAFVADKLKGLGARRGPFLEGGVVVSSFFPMRAIPFRVVFALGLGEGKFPAPGKTNPLDLQSFEPRPGDVTQRAQDKYLFLETFLCARERLLLSYVARDELTGDPRDPSSVILDLFSFLHARYDVSEELTPLLPLRRYDQRNVGDLARLVPDEARHEAFAAHLGVEARARLEESASVETVRAQLDDAARAKLDAALGMHARGVAHAEPRQGLRVSIAALRAFLTCPVQGYAKFHLGEEDEDDDLRTLENEPFEQESKEKAPFLRKVWVDAQTRGIPLEAHLTDEVARLLRAGAWPVGTFGRAEKKRAATILENWSRELAAVPDLPLSHFRAHQFGSIEEHDRTTLVRPSVRIVLPDGREIEVVGRIAAMDAETQTYLHLVPTTGSLDGKKLERYQREAAMRLSLESALFAAAANRTSETLYFVTVISTVSTTKHFAKAVPGWKTDEARAWLASLIVDLLGDAPRHLLPHEVPFEWIKKPDSVVMHEKIQDFVDDHEAGSRNADYVSFARGPVRRVHELPIADEASLRALVERRLSPVLSRRLGEK